MAVNSDDIVVGGWGDDTLAGGRGADLVDGGAGNDTLWAEGNSFITNGSFESALSTGWTISATWALRQALVVFWEQPPLYLDRATRRITER